MTKTTKLLLIASMLGCIETSVRAEEILGVQVGEFRCLEKGQIPDFGFEMNNVEVGSFSMLERKSPFHDGTRIEVSFAVANRSDRDAPVVGQFVLLSNDSIAVAITAQPEFQRVRPGDTDVAKGSVFVSLGTLEKVDVVCVAF